MKRLSLREAYRLALRQRQKPPCYPETTPS